MATRNQVTTAGTNFRNALAGLANNGAFSPGERQGFAGLHLNYNAALGAFTLNPRYGDSSPNYDASLQEAQNGSAAVPGCIPGNPGSQQPVYNAANNGAADLRAVTA
jgi:hypothetical protein